MKNNLFFLLILICALPDSIFAQYRLDYEAFSIGSSGDTSHTTVLQNHQQLKIYSADPAVQNPIPGIATSYTYADYEKDTLIHQLYYSESEQYYVGSTLTQKRAFENLGTEDLYGYHCTKYSIVLFSNTIEIWMTDDLGINATPATGFAGLKGVLVQYCRNGNAILRLSKVQKDKSIKNLFPKHFGTVVSNLELDRIEKEKLVLKYTVFDSTQICFNSKLAVSADIPYDTALSFANGTVILKKIKMPVLPSHYLLFAELTEFSNGDAYDRTGSVFIIPTQHKQNFLQALTAGIDKIPYFTDKNGNQFQGMAKTDNYLPPVELMRFFTPFGVRHYNQYRSVDGIEWANEVHYKQEITDLSPLMNGDVYIGVFIGNYDAGGHIVSLDLKAYPQMETWAISDTANFQLQPLFNTCNVMEMAGQNYGTFFSTDSLTVTFTVPENAARLQLRYITTGHGGWDNGDEFVPKANTILIDGIPRFVYTPWRSDCGTFRAYNPASGNFWNGTSSSDYSRSGWCPGTATQPTYFDLTGLSAGKHTLTVAIPQGKREGNSFSAWNVSGILIATLKNHIQQ